MRQAAEEIAQEMEATRAGTLELFELAREEDLRRSPGFGFRPIIWHLAHIGVFEAYWILQRLDGESAPDERYERIFDPIKTPREESKKLPTRGEMEDYLARVRARVRRALDRCDFDERDPLRRDGYAFRLVLEHERQHQETLAYLLHLLPPERKRRPVAGSEASAPSLSVPRADEPAAPAARPREMVTIPAGPFWMGAVWDTFVYDNELPARLIELPAFKLDRLPVTNGEYARFVAEGGYERREFWDAEGWRQREREGWTAPLYWRREGQGWRVRGMFDEAALDPAHPVCGLSWYEADAYARFVGKRLPTEAEWEKAASWDARAERKRRFAWGDEAPTTERANVARRFWQTTPVGAFPAGASAYGCLDMTGNAWEWTSDPFAGYPGFAPFPYPEYSQEWFDGDHRVLKGGSWATSPAVLRTSFRNFFRRPFRIAFASLRCAAAAE